MGDIQLQEMDVETNVREDILQGTTAGDYVDQYFRTGEYGVEDETPNPLACWPLPLRENTNDEDTPKWLPQLLPKPPCLRTMVGQEHTHHDTGRPGPQGKGWTGTSTGQGLDGYPIADAQGEVQKNSANRVQSRRDTHQRNSFVVAHTLLEAELLASRCYIEALLGALRAKGGERDNISE